MRLLRDLALLILVFGGIWALFTYITVVPDKDFFNVPVETEKELGEDLFEWQIKNNPAFELIDNPQVDSLIALLGERLTQQIDSPLFSYDFYVVNSPHINAFTLPGGKIIVLSGLIELAETPEDIAAVLAHELGHAEERHIMNKLVKNLGLSVLRSNDGFVLAEVGKILGSTKFDRYQEERADDFSLPLLERAQIHPGHFAKIMRKMKEESAELPDNLEMFATHPDPDKRIKKALEFSVGKDFDERPIDVDLDLLKELLAD